MRPGGPIGNTITDSGTMTTPGFGIQEVSPSNKNMIIANLLTDNFSGPLYFVGARTEAVRNIGDVNVITADSGGFRQTIDGWSKSTVGPGENVELVRGNGRFRAVRKGFITGISITSSVDCTAGKITATVWRNQGKIGVAGSATALDVELNDTTGNTSRRSTPAPDGLYPFAAGDEIYVRIVTDGSWDPSATIAVAIEIKN